VFEIGEVTVELLSIVIEFKLVPSTDIDSLCKLEGESERD
jgi:hypothetical protein